MATLASAIDEDGQLSRSPSASRHTLKLFTNGDACNHSFAAKIASGIRQGERRPVHHQRQLPVGEARLSIWLDDKGGNPEPPRSEEHTSELQSHSDLVCRLLLEKKNRYCGQARILGLR